MALSKPSGFLIRASMLSRESLVIAGQEGLASRHPVVRLLAVHVEQLQLQTLVQHHASLDPGLLQVSPLLVQSLQFLLDLWTGVVAAGQQLLTKLLEHLEGPRARVDPRAVLLVPLQKSLGSSDVLGQFLGGHQSSDAVDPRHQVSDVRQEALQVVGVAQLVLALVGSSNQNAPCCVELGALLLDIVHGLGVRLDESLRGLPQRVYFVPQGSQVSLKALVLTLQGLS